MGSDLAYSVYRRDFGETVDSGLDWYIEPSPGRDVVFVMRDASGETFTSCESCSHEYEW